jgi:hypothetical protein
MIPEIEWLYKRTKKNYGLHRFITKVGNRQFKTKECYAYLSDKILEIEIPDADCYEEQISCWLTIKIKKKESTKPND